MAVKFLRFIVQLNIFIGWRKSSEKKYHIGITNLTPDEVWKALWPIWSVNLTSYSMHGQVLSLKKEMGNHQYHLRMFHDDKIDAPGWYRIEIHYEAAWRCTWEHAHEIDLRAVSLAEIPEVAILLPAR